MAVDVVAEFSPQNGGQMVLHVVLVSIVVPVRLPQVDHVFPDGLEEVGRHVPPMHVMTQVSDPRIAGVLLTLQAADQVSEGAHEGGKDDCGDQEEHRCEANLVLVLWGDVSIPHSRHGREREVPGVDIACPEASTRRHMRRDPRSFSLAVVANVEPKTCRPMRDAKEQEDHTHDAGHEAEPTVRLDEQRNPQRQDFQPGQADEAHYSGETQQLRELDEAAGVDPFPRDRGYRIEWEPLDVVTGNDLH
mmetsp:Transcript_93262/g.216755  ORF Transcript_93262/g.216755 Transcript_93262/m.216755 type:complete len:247 (+) Transcript_93262:1044-1784(+)